METRPLNITKQQAQEWLKSDVKELRDLALKTFPELGEMEWPESWNELEEIIGFWVASASNIYSYGIAGPTTSNKNVAAYESYCTAYLAMCQLSHLHQWVRKNVENDEVIDWEDHSTAKFIIHKNHRVYKIYDYEYPIAFSKEKTAEKFLETYHPLLEQAKLFL